MSTSKICSSCQESKPKTEFHVNRSKKDGLKSSCKQCCHDAYITAKGRAKNAVPAVSHKTCRLCDTKKSIVEFGKNSNMRDGYQSLCKPCYHDHVYLPNKDKITERSVRWQKDNPDRVKKIKDNWRQNNSNKIIASSRKYYNTHRESILARNKAWCVQNPVKARERTLRRLARKNKNIIFPFSKTMLSERMSVFDNRCAYCGGPFDHIDHLKPLSMGGAHCLGNLRPSCQSCNLQKGAMNPFDWLASLQQ